MPQLQAAAPLTAFDPFHDAHPTRVIEIGEITAGIAVPERGGVRFFSSAPGFDGLDGALFGSIEQVARAARDRSRAGPRRLRAV